MRRQKTFVTIMILVCVFLSGVPADVCIAGNPTSYIITVKEVRLKRSTDSQWVTIATPNQEVDISEAGQNAAAATFSSVTVPAGSYDSFMLVLSDEISFSGSDTVGLTTYYTKDEGVIDCTGTEANDGSTYTWDEDPPLSVEGDDEENPTMTTNSGEQGEVSEICDLANNDDGQMLLYMFPDSDTPVTINADSTVSMYFDFDTQGTVHVTPGLDQMFLLPPQEGSEFGITVDGVTYLITADQMRIDF